MKSRILPFLLIFILGSFGILSFSGLSLMDYGEHHICPIAAISGGVCPPVHNALALVIHHISGLQGFTQGVISLNVNLLVLSILLITALLFVTQFFIQTFLFKGQRFYKIHSLTEKLSSSIKQFFFWSALNNKRELHLSLEGV